MCLFTSWGVSLRQHDDTFQRQAHLKAGTAIKSKAGVDDAEVEVDIDAERPASIEGREVVEPNMSSYSSQSSSRDKIVIFSAH